MSTHIDIDKQLLDQMHTQGRRNNFDFLRFLAASMVIYSHAFPLGAGSSGREPMFAFSHGQMSFGVLAVRTFFIMSGFLIVGSFERSRGLVAFTRARVLRIFPGLIVAALFTAFVIGPIMTSLSLGDYFSSAGTYGYLRNATLRGPDSLPGVFAGNVTPILVNGSLWTLYYEFLCYIMVAALGVTRLIRKPAITLVFLVSMLPVPSGWYFHRGFLMILQPLLAAFAAGMLFYIYRDRIPLSRYLFICSFICLLAANYAGWLNQAFPIFGAYMVMYAAFSPTVKLNNFAKRGDISYGVYVYAFPVQQSITGFFGGRMDPMVNFLIAFPITMMLAAMSWHFVEERCLKLKAPSRKPNSNS